MYGLEYIKTRPYIRDGFAPALSPLFRICKKHGALNHVQSYAFHYNGGQPVKAYYVSALHLRDDLRIRPEHRLSPNADSL
jgi:hypothetical protein